MPIADATFEDGPLRVDFERRVVTLKDEPVELDPHEYDVLAALVKRHGNMLSSEQIGQLYGSGPAGAKLVCLLLLEKLGVRDHEYPWEGVIQHGSGGYRYESGHFPTCP